MTQGGSTSKRKKRSSSQRTNLEEERETSKIRANQISPPDINLISASTKTKRRLNSNRTGITKREEGSLHSRKRKGKIGYIQPTKEQSVPKRVAPRRRKLTVQQEDEGSSIDFERRSQLTTTDLQGPTRKRIREATCIAESQLKTLTKPRKLTKSRYRFLPKLTNIKEESSSPRLLRGNLVDDMHAAVISDKEKDKSKLQHKDIHHRTSSSDHVETKVKRRSLNIGNVDKVLTRKFSLMEKSRAGKQRKATKKLDTLELNALRQKQTQLLRGSHGLHSLIRKSTLSRVVNNTDSINVHNVETADVKVQDEVIEKSNYTVDVECKDIRKKIESAETAKALKVANDTSGFVRTTLKAVEDSKNISLNIKEGMSKKKKDDVNIDKKPNKIAELVAERYKITLDALQSKQTLTAHTLIEELVASNGNATKGGKLGKRHTGRFTKTNFKKDMKDGSTGKEMAKESDQSDVTDDGTMDAKHIKLGRKTRKSSGNQMIDKLTKNQGLSASIATKKSKSPMVSGFHRLVCGAHGDKEFESALAQIVTSHHGELGWTNEQQKALQEAYLSKKQTDGDFWHLISEEVPGRNAKECHDRFYSRHPTPAREINEPATKCQNESEFPSSRSSETKDKGTSLKGFKKQKQFEAQKTIRNILRHVDDMGGHETNNTEVEIDHPETMQDVKSVLDRMEHDHAVILQSNPSKDYNNVASHLKGNAHDSHGKAFFENVVISGVSSVSDKENNQPRNGQDINNKKVGVPRVELTLKQAAHGEHFPYDGGPKTTSNVRKKKIIKSSNVYLHSKDALDFGDSTLDAIQRAKEELRNVFSRTGSTGGSFFDNEAITIAE